jgi:hypothetical protein
LPTAGADRPEPDLQQRRSGTPERMVAHGPAGQAAVIFSAPAQFGQCSIWIIDIDAEGALE